MLFFEIAAHSVPYGVAVNPYFGVSLSVALARMIGCSLVAVAALVLSTPAALNAQVGLASGGAQIALIARASPRASIRGAGSTRETGRSGALREHTVTLRLAANTGYRLVVVGTAPVTAGETPLRLWVRAENGRFEELTSGAGVTVVRGRHAVGDWQPEVSFRSETSASGESSQPLPVRYEVRIDPTI